MILKIILTTEVVFTTTYLTSLILAAGHIKKKDKI